MKNLSTALSYSAVLLDPSVAAGDIGSVPRTVSHSSRALPVRNGAQAALLAALGTLSSSLTLVYFTAQYPPALLVGVALLWSLWLSSFIDWLRGERPSSKPAPIGLAVQRLEADESNSKSVVRPRCWERVADRRAEPGLPPGNK